MNFILRDERPDDAAAIAAVTTAAFLTTPQASGNEAAIVRDLRAKGALTLSLIAEIDGEIVGHAGFSPATIGGTGGWSALGPLSVLPARHKCGIGSALLRCGLQRLRATGVSGCVLVGDPNYYGRFGFRPAPGLTCEGVPDPYVMALSFAGEVPAGAIAFDPAFFTAR